MRSTATHPLPGDVYQAYCASCERVTTWVYDPVHGNYCREH